MKTINELSTELVVAIAGTRKAAITEVINDLLAAPDCRVSKRDLLGLDKKRSKPASSDLMFGDKGLF